MRHREVELLAIGAGPSNLALAVALEELDTGDLPERTLLIEQAQSVTWQPGMLLPWAKTQVSFLKDLVTLRNPCSRFSFLNYLHDRGRLDEFVNLGTFTPYRSELSDYLQWAADSLSRVEMAYGLRCTSVEPCRDRAGAVSGWLTHLDDGATIRSRYLVIGIGREPNVPRVFANVPRSRVIHSTQYVPRVAELTKAQPHRVAVIGGAQSAAEMFHAVQQDLPGCDVTLVTRSIGLGAYESSKFVNELFYPTFIDEFYGCAPDVRRQILGEMHRTNYSGVAGDLLDGLYRQIYLDRLNGTGRLHMLTLHDVTAAEERDGEVVLTLYDRRTGEPTQLRSDVVLLGTGFVRGMPKLVRQLGDALGLSRLEVSRNYRLAMEKSSIAACYLQGVNEATHGIADSLLSVVARRACDLTEDIVTHRAARPTAAAA
jgi:L-ornithine N5-oxygenase